VLPVLAKSWTHNADSTEWTVKLKSGIKFSPPVNRAVTSHDFVTAMNREANPKDGAQYAFYYTVIKGWDAYAAGKAKGENYRANYNQEKLHCTTIWLVHCRLSPKVVQLSLLSEGEFFDRRNFDTRRETILVKTHGKKRNRNSSIRT
jgi:hypothetical protein